MKLQFCLSQAFCLNNIYSSCAEKTCLIVFFLLYTEEAAVAAVTLMF